MPHLNVYRKLATSNTLSARVKGKSEGSLCRRRAWMHAACALLFRHRS